MLCPHCGHENVEGRRYCRSCAKPLAAEAAAAKPAPVPLPALPSPLSTVAQARVSPASPSVSNLAIASLALSFLALIPPVGIASVVMGHISRRQIAASQGRQTGTGLAFAGLILSYLQLAVMGVLFVVLICVGYQTNQNLNRNPDVRAALVERMISGDPNHPSAAMTAGSGENLMDALRLIEARQETYRTEHSGNYACSLNYLEPDSRDDELSVHVRNSYYSVKVICTGADEQGNAGHYAATAYPRSEGSSGPVYCLDEKKIIRRYSDANALNEVASYHSLNCPEDGEAVE